MTDADKVRKEEALLLVDGEVIARHALVEYLRSCGYSVIAAASTEEAVIVLTDADYVVSAMLCALPAVGSQSGFALAQWVRDNHPSVQIVFAGTLDAAAEAASKFCAEWSRLARPYDRDVIVEWIDLMRERRRQNLATDTLA